MIGANLALRFLLELFGLAAVGYSGWQVAGGPFRWVAAILAPLALAAFWALVVAPNASNGVPLPTRELIGSALLVAVGGGLALAGQPWLGTAFAGLVIANTVVLTLLGHPGTPAAEVTR